MTLWWRPAGWRVSPSLVLQSWFGFGLVTSATVQLDNKHHTERDGTHCVWRIHKRNSCTSSISTSAFSKSTLTTFDLFKITSNLSVSGSCSSSRYCRCDSLRCLLIALLCLIVAIFLSRCLKWCSCSGVFSVILLYPTVPLKGGRGCLAHFG